MNIWVQMILLVTVACLCVANASPEMRGRTKQQRPTRGFKNAEMMTARGFGKRNRLVSRTPQEEARSRRAFKPNGKVLIARGYGKRDNMIDLSSVYGGEQPEQTHWETFEQPGEVDPNDTRDEEADRSKMESHRNVDFVETTTEHSDSEKENVQLRHTVVEKKRSKLAKPRPRSVKSMKMAKGVNKRKPTGEEKKRKPPKHIASISVDTFTKEMIKNPDFAKTVVRRFIDRNLDGYLTEEELLKIRV